MKEGKVGEAKLGGFRPTALSSLSILNSVKCRHLCSLQSSDQLMCVLTKVWIELSSDSNCDFAAISLDFVIFARCAEPPAHAH